MTPPKRALLARAALSFAALLTLFAAPTASASPILEGPRERVHVLQMPGGMVAAAAHHHAKGKRVFWLNFEGVRLISSNMADDATTDKSVILSLGGLAPGQGMNIPAFSVDTLSGSGGMTRQQIIDYTVAQLETMFEPYDVQFVLERPKSGIYEAIVFGGSCSSVLGQAGCGGVALADCGNTAEKNITFVFPVGLDYRDLAPTAAQESAHAFGLAHTTDDSEVMFPYIQPGVYPDHFGNTDASCPSQEVQQGSTCGKSSQNSHEAMLSVIGPKGQDVYGPNVSITSHTDGMTIRPGDMVIAQVNDEQSGVMRAELSVNNTSYGEVASSPFQFEFPADVVPGNASVVVTGYDTKGNQSTDRVTLYVPSGDETSCSADGDCPDGRECNGEFCVPDNGVNELGEDCADGQMCDADLQCGTVQDEKRCTQECDATRVCPDGFECLGDADGAVGACWPGEDSGGCNVGSAAGLPGLLALLGLALMRRRRRR